MKYVGAALLGLGLGLAIVTPAAAQPVQSIAAVVNDEVVSAYDLERRLKLVISATRAPTDPKALRQLRSQVLASLVDETLQLQEARRLNIRVTDADLQREISLIEQHNNISAGRLDDYLRARNVEKDVLVSRLRAEISWRKLVFGRLRGSLAVSDEEIDEAIARMKRDQGQSESLLSEIFLPVDSPDLEEDVRQQAERLVARLREGTPPFGAAAQRLSRGATAGSGGAVGWVQPGQLPRQLDQALSLLGVGEISDPVRVPGGFYVIKLDNRRKLLVADPDQTEVTITQIILPLTSGAAGREIGAQKSLASTIRQSIHSCGDADAVIKKINSSESGPLGTLRVGELPAPFRAAIATLAIGEPSVPVVTESAVHVLVVCERVEAVAKLPSRDAIGDRLKLFRLSMMARRYLRDLRRDAVVEYR